MTNEDRLQIAVMTYAKLAYPNILIFHCPNGGSRNGAEGAKLKKMGVLKGVSDVIVMHPKGIHTGLVMELKVKPNKPTEDQYEFMRRARGAGWMARVCYSFDE